jgi:hypothetical protein
MGIYSYGYKAGKKLLQNIFTKKSPDIKSVKPGQNLAKKRKIQDEKTKTTSQIVDGLSDEGKRNVRTKNPLAKFNKKIADIYDKKAKGGRVGLKAGTNPFKKKTNVEKIKETFGTKKRVNAKSGFPDLSGDGKTTFKDILIGRGVIKKKNGKNKKKVI